MSLLHGNDQPGRHPPSWYAATAQAPGPYPVLAGDLRPDVCIVGGGFTGLSAALHLAQTGLQVVLLEAHRVGFGASGRNGGQLGSGQRQGQDWIEARMGDGPARALWDIAEQAKALVHALCDTHGIDAEYRPGVVHAASTRAEARASWDEADKLQRHYGYDQIERLDHDALSRLIGSGIYTGGTLDNGAGHVHPLKLAFGLARAAEAAGVQIFEQSEVRSIHEGAETVLRTARGAVRARQAILALNGYHERLNRKIAARVLPINNFIAATEPLGDRLREVFARDVAVADDKFVINYWRPSADGRILFGGGESYGDRFPRDIRAVVGKPFRKVYPQLADVGFDYAWGGTLGITTARMPYFGRLAPNILTAGGYSGHGVALSVMAGKIMAEAARGQAGQFDLMASIPVAPLPGGPALRRPLMVLAMTWYALRDRLGL